MSLPAEPLLNAYLAVLQHAIVYSRFIAYQNGPCDQIADLLDAVHVIPELLNNWQRCDEPGLRRFLVAYDQKWAADDDSFSLIKVFEEAYFSNAFPQPGN